MKTVVYQSYRKKNVPAWINSAMAIAKKWAEGKGYTYIFIDDRMFDYVPEWFKNEVDNQVCPVSDLARLAIAKELLANGFERAIWLDADLIILDPEQFDIAVDTEFALTKEIWLESNRFGFVTYYTRVCNEVLVITNKNSILDFYIYACKSIVHNKSPWINRFKEDTSPSISLKRLKSRLTPNHSRLSISIVGTDFLTNLYKLFDFPLLTNVGTLSPVLMNEVFRGRTKYLKNYIKRCNTPLSAVNLIGSFQNLRVNAVLMDEPFYERVYQNLVETKGRLINDLLTD